MFTVGVQKKLTNPKPYNAEQFFCQSQIIQMTTLTKSIKLTEGVSSGGAINFW